MSESLRALIISKGGLQHVSEETGIARSVLQRWYAGENGPKDASRIETIRRLPTMPPRRVGRPWRFALCDERGTVLTRHQTASGVVFGAMRLPIYRKRGLQLHVWCVDKSGKPVGDGVPLAEFKETLA